MTASSLLTVDDPGLPDAELVAIVVALLRAHLAGDETAVGVLVDAVSDPVVLLAVAVGFMTDELARLLPGGMAELDERLATLQEEYRATL